MKTGYHISHHIKNVDENRPITYANMQTSRITSIEILVIHLRSIDEVLRAGIKS